MKTIERIKDEVAQKYGHTNFRSFKVKCLRMAHQLHDMIPLMEEVAETYAKEQISIAVEKYKKKLLDSGLNNDFDVLAAQTQILEELKGGEGE